MRNGKQKNKINNFWLSQKIYKNIEIAKTQGKNSVVIEKQGGKFLIEVVHLDQVLKNQNQNHFKIKHL